MRGTRVLIVEDDRSIVRLLQLELEYRGFSVRCAFDGMEALEEFSGFAPEIIVLDIMLPRLDGVGVLKHIRERGSSVPVIMLTAKDGVPDKIHSLTRGADDYMTKPFDIEELVARMSAVMRRVEGEEVLKVSDLEVNSATREVRRGERKIELTAREHALLEFLMRNARRVVSRDVLLSRVWEDEVGLSTNAVDVYIGYVRKKVDHPGEQKLIHTVRGVGYTLKAS